MDYVVTRAVQPDDGGFYYARERNGSHYFRLICGHEWPCKTKNGFAVPLKADWRPCEPCKAAYEAKGLPLPLCPLCRGRGTITTGSHRYQGGKLVSASFSKKKCEACKGKTRPCEES